VKEKLSDLAPWLEKLLVTLAKVNPNDDRDEVERRSELEKFASWLRSFIRSQLILDDRSLKGIEKRSLDLLAKGKVTRLLDKTQDSGEVVKLVEELRRAILVYQVSFKHHQSR